MGASVAPKKRWTQNGTPLLSWQFLMCLREK
jgi:hypothetical protein